MWLNERRRGPGWSASSRQQQRRFLLVLLPERCGRGHPRAGDSRREDASPRASSGPRPAAPGGSGLGVSGSRLRAGGARISCRGSRAPGAAPLDRTIRARGRGRRRRRRWAFEVLGAPARSPRRGAALVAPGLREGGYPAATPAGWAPRRPQQLRQRQEQGRSIFCVRARWPFPPSLLIFSSCYCDLMAL